MTKTQDLNRTCQGDEALKEPLQGGDADGEAT